MYPPTDSYKQKDPHVVNEERDTEAEIGCNDNKKFCSKKCCITVTPQIMEEWRENMIFWKNHDTCRRMFNWVREVLGSLDEYFLKKIFNKLINDGELVNDHVRMYLHMRGYDVKGRDIIDTPYWMHAALLQVMHLVYLDDDVMLSEPIEELTRPRLQHKNARNITIMLNIFFGYISERPFLLTEFPMNDWRNNVDHIDKPGVSGVVIDEGYTENKDRLKNPTDENPILPFDNTGCLEEGEDNPTENLDNDSDIQSCSIRLVSNPSPSNVEINDACAELNGECTAHTTDEKDDNSRLDISTAENLNIPLPSLMDSHPSWNTLVFQSSSRSSSSESGRRTNLKITAKEKAQFNTLVFKNLFERRRENYSFMSKLDNNKKLAVKARSGIFFGLTIFFKDLALSISQNLKTIVTCNGGKVCEKLRKTATHIVTSKPVPWYKVDELRRCTNCRVVKPEWVLECTRVGRRVNEDAFNMAGLQLAQPTISGFLNGGTNQLSSADDLPNTRKRRREVNDLVENKRHRVNSYVGSNNCDVNRECAINKYGLIAKKNMIQ